MTSEQRVIPVDEQPRAIRDQLKAVADGLEARGFDYVATKTAFLAVTCEVILENEGVLAVLNDLVQMADEFRDTAIANGELGDEGVDHV